MAAVLTCPSLGRRRLWDRPEHLQRLLDAARGRVWAWVQGQQQQQGQAWGCCSLGELLQGFFVFYQDLFSDWLLGKRRCVQAGKQAGTFLHLCGLHEARLHTRVLGCNLWFQGPHPGVGGMCGAVTVCSKQSRPAQGQLGVLRSCCCCLCREVYADLWVGRLTSQHAAHEQLGKDYLLNLQVSTTRPPPSLFLSMLPLSSGPLLLADGAQHVD